MPTALIRKPKAKPSTPFPTAAESLHREGNWLWIPLRGEWRDVAAKPEEIVRQTFIRHLIDHYGYSLAQMDQERRTQHGHKSPRADIVIWETPEKKANNNTPVLVVECKSEGVDINVKDYYQGESYTRAVGCEFFIAHNTRFTAVFKLVPGLPGDFVQINEIARASDWGDAKRIEEIKNKLRAFNRKEFQDLLFKCHSILRDVHKMEPGRAFDTISKILFVKMYVERSGLHGTFTVDFLDRRASTRLPTDPQVHDGLFEQTKNYYKADDLFTANDRLEISEETFRRLVKELERFDLSKTGDDIKGLAFERFLGNTFRGELGQFFTPRPVVDFMVSLLDPQEGELICDPAAGSGGFLIRAFEHVRTQIGAAIQADKDNARYTIEAEGLDPDEEEARIDAAFAALNKELLPSDDENRPVDTRVGRLAWNCIFGCDAEPRAARTAKMNMIMHGDGHGGIHYHDGLVDINGIFPGRFDIVITNPPFGSNVGSDQKVGGSDETRVLNDAAYRARCVSRYGAAWEESHDRMLAAATVKASLVFLKRFTKKDQKAWDAAWTAAHAAHDATFNAERDALCATYGPRIVSGDDKKAADILTKLAALGVKRTPPAWFSADPPPYPKSIGATKLRRVAWHDDAKDRAKAAALKNAYTAAFTSAVATAADALTRELAAALRALDERHNAALWSHVREAFDYPVFVAAPKSVGITSTGETGENVPNDLPDALDAFKRFQSWAAAGAKPKDIPDFRLPSAA